ncbi:MAG: ribosome small subunit-dependent GTPase A [Bacteroidales bacterium]|nr:ribosome small subunit-dependent GTPase A [Bacteroidales bacterium]
MSGQFEGTVVKTTGALHWVRTSENRIIPCTLKGRFRIRGKRTTNPVAVGDQVMLNLTGYETTGVITILYPRKNYIIRKATKLSRETHVLAANVDQAMVMVTLKSPKTLSMFVDRLLVSAEAYNIPVILLFNKLDLYNRRELEQLDEWRNAYLKAGYPSYPVSLKNKSGLEFLNEILREKLTVLVGNSGVGKTTLINFLEPDIQLKTAEISDAHKGGKHTTTFPEMISLKNGGDLIDTPGIRGFGMVDIMKEELYHFFPELFRYAAGCQYHNCTHTHEPGCAVKKAVDSGDIAGMRYRNYLNMMAEKGDKYRQGY